MRLLVIECFRERGWLKSRKKLQISTSSTFTIDLIAALPISEAFIWLQIQASKNTTSLSQCRIYVGAYMMFWIQVYPRLYDVYYTKIDATKTLVKSGMSGAFYNLLCFTGISHVLGAVYYFLLINWILWCRDVMDKEAKRATFEWDQLLSNCTQNKNIIEQGIFSSAIKNKIWKRNFIQKLMFCFSWGLKSVSSLGQNFTTSFSIMETSFKYNCHLVRSHYLRRFDYSNAGLSVLLYIKASIQSMEERKELQRARQHEIKEWIDYHQLPLVLKERIDLSIQSQWTKQGLDDEALLDSLPLDLRSEIWKYLYMDIVCKLPKFANMESPLVEAICQHLKTFSGKESTYIVFEGDEVKQMFFIFSGCLELSFTNMGNSSLTILGQGECCGEELVTWASQPTFNGQPSLFKLDHKVPH